MIHQQQPQRTKPRVTSNTHKKKNLSEVKGSHGGAKDWHARTPPTRGAVHLCAASGRRRLARRRGVCRSEREGRGSVDDRRRHVGVFLVVVLAPVEPFDDLDRLVVDGSVVFSCSSGRREDPTAAFSSACCGLRKRNEFDEMRDGQQLRTLKVTATTLARITS